jgi:hypothetical protein
VTQQYDSAGCQDHYTGSTDPYCALYQIQLLPPNGESAQVPAAPTTSGLITTVQLAGPATAVTITYHQVGACNGGSFGVGDGPVETYSCGTNAAYVIFGITSISNPGAIPFNFNPGNLFVQQGSQQDSFSNNLELDSQIFPSYVQSESLNPATTIPGVGSSEVQFGAAIVSTVATDGASQADGETFVLGYNRQSGDPAVNLVKSNPTQTFPYTPGCSEISYQ